MEARSRHKSQEDEVIAKSPFPITSAFQRLNREALGTYYRAYYSKGYLTLADRLVFAGQLAPDTSQTVRLFAYGLADDQANNELVPDRWANLEYLHFASYLNPAQWSILTSGQALFVGDLNPVQRSILERLVYGSRYTFLRERGFDISSEPTELLPYGLPPSAVISMPIEGEYFVSDSSYYPDARHLDVQYLAMAIMDQDQEVLNRHYYLGIDRDFNFSVRFSEEHEIFDTFTDRYLERRMKPIRINQLPPVFQEAIRKVLDEKEQELKD